MKKKDDLARLAKSIRNELDACENEERKDALLVNLVEAINKFGKGRKPRPRRHVQAGTPKNSCGFMPRT